MPVPRDILDDPGFFDEEEPPEVVVVPSLGENAQIPSMGLW
jgi:hypothetical protein